ncbi:MAG: glycosyltransferase family 39 protein [Hydrogenophilus sp.]|nr:glycosyltransferase family 39 protein [Hydrogenophilus sp.]
MRLLLSLTTLPLRRIVTLTLWGAALAFILDGLHQHTPSNDEWVQHTYGELLWDFYLSGLLDRTFLTFSNLYLYGGFFDLIAAGLTRLFSLPWWPLRHLLTALFGLLALAATMRLARLIAGPTAAPLAGFLLLLTGPFWGAIFTHTKDIPFAAAMAWALYYTIRLAQHPLAPQRRHLILWGIATGAALGLRVAGILIPFFLFVSLFAASLSLRPSPTAAPSFPLSSPLRVILHLPSRAVFPSPRLLATVLTAHLPALFFALPLILFSWPWVAMGWDHLFLALTKFSHFAFDIYTWEDGERLKNAAVSRWYLHHYLLVRLPEVTLLGPLGLLFPLFSSRFSLTLLQRRAAITLVAALFFILLYVALTRPPLYNGLRHFLFLIPWIVALAAAGWFSLWRTLFAPSLPSASPRPSSYLSPLSLSLRLTALLIGFGTTLIAAVAQHRLHPYEHLYYNTLVGGLAGADGSWETDYWSDATRALIPAIRRWADRERPARTVYLAYCAEKFQIEPWLPPNVLITEDWRDADLFLSTTHDDCHLALPGTPIAAVVRLGVPLAILKEVHFPSPTSSPPPSPSLSPLPPSSALPAAAPLSSPTSPPPPLFAAVSLLPILSLPPLSSSALLPQR